MQAEEVQRGDLRDERLRRGDGDLGAGVRVDDRVGLARDRRALRVADRQRARAVLAGVLDRHERVHRLARLADRDDERVVADHRVAVAELVRELDVDGHARPLLDRVLADHARVGGGAARDDDDARDADEELVETVELGNHDLAVARCDRRIVLATASGSSLISLAMKLDQPPLSAAEASHRTSNGSTSTASP